MTTHLSIPFDYDSWEYFEFVWRYEKLVKKEQELPHDENRFMLENLNR